MTQPNDIIAMARAAKSLHAAAAEDDTPGPSDELFVRAAVAFSMLMWEMAVIVPDLDAMNRDHAICTIALNFADHPPSTKGRADLFATVLPDYVQALQKAVAGNRRVLGMLPQSGDVMTIARFDYAGTPPRGRSWAAFKLSHDPPGLRTASYGGSVFWVHVTVGAEHPVDGPFSASACAGAWLDADCAHVEAWLPTASASADDEYPEVLRG